MKKDIFYKDSMNSYVINTLANHCMPTLLKLKTASLVNFNKKYVNSKKEFIQTLQGELKQFYVDYEILFENESMYCILIYQYDLLYKVIQRFHTNHFIFDSEYYGDDIQVSIYLSILKKRYHNYMKEINIDFPHEVGIFLGYPMIDVAEYIINKGENYLLSGYWKVYHNVNKAKRVFFIYTEIRKSTIELINSGKSLNEINKMLKKDYCDI